MLPAVSAGVCALFQEPNNEFWLDTESAILLSPFFIIYFLHLYKNNIKSIISVYTFFVTKLYIKTWKVAVRRIYGQTLPRLKVT